MADIAASELEKDVFYTGYTYPGQFHALTQEEVDQQPSLDSQVAVLAKQRDRLQIQLFGRIGRITKKLIKDESGKENHYEIISPKELPTDNEWKDYLTGELMYHSLAQRQSLLNHNLEEGRGHDLEAMRAELALGTLNGVNKRGDLVVVFANKVKMAAEKTLADSPKESPWLPLLKERVNYADRMVTATTQRFG